MELATKLLTDAVAVSALDILLLPTKHAIKLSILSVIIILFKAN